MAGGRLLGMWLWDAYADYRKQQNPLFDEGNPIVIAPGALGDLGLAMASGFAVVTKSPVTGFVECAYGEGSFCEGLCALGLAAIVLVGKRRRTTTLVIESEHVSFVLDDTLRFLSPQEASSHYPGYHVAAIGSAAYRGCRYSSLVCDKENVGRGGMGLVFANKNVKMIAIRAERHPRSSYDAVEAWKICNLYQGLKSTSLISMGRKNGWIALHGFHDFSDGRLWSLSSITDRLFAYLALGPNIGLFDPAHIEKLIHLCDETGVDPLSSGILLLVAKEEHMVETSRYAEVIASLGSDTYRDDEAMKRYRIGPLELLPLDLRVLPASALLASLGEDAILYDELLGKGGEPLIAGDNLALAKMALGGVEMQMAVQTWGLGSSCHYLGYPKCMALLSRLATIGEGHRFSQSDVVSLSHLGMRLRKGLDAKLGGRRGGEIPDLFFTSAMYGDGRERLVRIGRLKDVYLALWDVMVNS